MPFLRRIHRPLRPLLSRPYSSSPKAPDFYHLFPRTLPFGPPPAGRFTPDLRSLKQEFFRLQQSSHPDVASRNPSTGAVTHSSTYINKAYATLRDPLLRSQYLLLQHGIDVEDEASGEKDMALLTEVMEAREAVDAAATEDEVDALRLENDARIDGCVTALEQAWTALDLETAARETVRLKFWRSVKESLEGWEEGKGAGRLEH